MALDLKLLGAGHESVNRVILFGVFSVEALREEGLIFSPFCVSKGSGSGT